MPRKPKRKRAKYRKVDRTIWPIVAPLFRGKYPVLTKTIVGLLDIKKGDHVLETHCGTRSHFKTWKATVGEKGRVVAMDIDPFIAGIQRIKQKLRLRKNRAEIQIGNAEKLHFKDNSFDKYVITLPDRLTDNIVSEMRRVLKPGGLAFVMDSDDKIEHLVRNQAKGFSVVKTSEINMSCQFVVLKKKPEK